MKQLKKLLVNLFCLFIRNKKQRDSFRCGMNRFLWRCFLTDFIQVRRFRASKVQNRVLLVEVNDFHAEVIAGYLAYFQQSGYAVDVLINAKIEKEKPFVRQDMQKVNVFSCGAYGIRKILNSEKLNEYKCIFIMSAILYPSYVLDEYRKLKYLKNICVVEHDLKDVKSHQEEDLCEKGRLITLGKFNRGVFVNPCRFGQVAYTEKNKETRFIVVGAINAAFKNHQILIDAIKELSARGKSFKVVVIGNGKLRCLPENVAAHIEFKGRLSFPKMFDELEKADFYLPLLDDLNEKHKRYVTTGVTGSAQLIYAFAKIPVIQTYFADFYRFTDENAVLYASELTKAMADAIDVLPEQYKKMQAALIRTADAIRSESESNLEKILGRGK